MAQKSNKVEIRVTDLEKKDWQEAAGGARLVSSWLRGLANAECERRRRGEDAVEDLVAAGAQKKIEAQKTSLSTAHAIIPEKPVVPSGQCPRWMHHRSGTYCGSCKKVIK